MVDMDQFILYNQCHGCVCPGNARRQGTNSHGFDLVLPEYAFPEVLI